LTFLGTRGNIDVRSRRHRRHTMTFVSYRGTEVLLDCGADWLGEFEALNPSAIVLTHAHSDHVDGLRRGAPCPVYSTDEVWQAIRRWAIRNPRRLQRREPIRIGHLFFEAFPVVHSIRAPAVGYRITGGAATIFYVPDVLEIPDVGDALRRIKLYIGDGATIIRPIVRRRGPQPTGHASIAAQLDWCAREEVRHAIFTHCGTPVVKNAAEAERQIATLAGARGVDAAVAHDGLQLVVR
jgi:phosphoribosyl 1,2-cyclic phosphodiesterase